MICPKCNAENTEGSLCCAKCGNFLPKTPKEPKVEQEPVIEEKVEETTTVVQEKNTPVEEVKDEVVTQVEEQPIEEQQPIENTSSTVEEATPTEQTVAPVVAEPVVNPTDQNKKGNKGVLIVIILIIALIGVGGYLGIKMLSDKKDDKSDNTTTTTTTTTTTAVIEDDKKEEKKTGLNKLKDDYKNGKIDINKYFMEMVNITYADSRLDSTYKEDKIYMSEQIDINDFVKNNIDKLDKDLIKYYYTNYLLLNITFGDPDEVTPTTTNNNDISLDLLQVDNSKLTDEEKKYYENLGNHTLTYALLSKNKRFIVFYTTVGDDKITYDQALATANGLEDAVESYESLFGITYKFNSYTDPKRSDDYKKLKKILDRSSIDEKYVTSAMHVYIYNTGSTSICATYTRYGSEDWLFLNDILNVEDDDGIVGTPHIVMNQRMMNNTTKMREVYNHELFHHFQYLYCRENSEGHEACKAPLTITEGMANLASALISNSTSEGFLYDWADSSKDHLWDDFEKRPEYDASGYGLFPYYYSYYKTLGLDTLMKAHMDSIGIYYIMDNTEPEDLRKVINDYLRRILEIDYPSKSFTTDNYLTEVSFNDIRKVLVDGENLKEIPYDLEAGAIRENVIDKGTTIKATTEDSDYVTLFIYGYKNNEYYKLEESNTEVTIDTTLYPNYDKFYFIATNGNLIRRKECTIETTNSKYESNSTFKTGIKNYKIDVWMETEISGITVEVNTKGVVDQEHQKSYMETTSSTMGIPFETKMYYDLNSGYSYMTQPFGADEWWKQKEVSQLVDLDGLLETLTSMQNVTKIDDSHYRIKMNKNDMKGLMDSTSSDVSMISGDIYVDVYVKDGYITKLDYDYSKAIKGMSMKTTIKFSDYNTNDEVKIPTSVVENAKFLNN